MGGALASATLAKAGVGGYVLAIAVGLVVGVCCAWTMWIVHKIVVTSLHRRPDWEHSEWFLRAFYFSKIFQRSCG